MSWKTYRPGRTSRTQDEPRKRVSGTDREALGCLAVIVIVVVGVVVGIVLGIRHEIRSGRDWEQWCADQHGLVVDESRIPPEQVRDAARRYCVVDGRVVGAS